MSYDDRRAVTAEIDGIVLARVALVAYESFKAEHDAASGRHDAVMAEWNKRSWWVRNFCEGPAGGMFDTTTDGWDAHYNLQWMERAEVLIRIGETARISHIRIRERDINLLRPFLAKDDLKPVKENSE